MKILKKIKPYLDYLKIINLDILSSSLTFYIIIIFIPLSTIINSLLDYLNIIKIESNLFTDNTFLNTIILLITIIFIISKLTNILSVYSDIIYKDIEVRDKIKLKIRSIIFVFILILLIVLLIILSLYITYLNNKIFKLNNYFINSIKMLINFISIVIINGIIYKYIIPIKVKFKNTVLVSLLITLVWYIILFIYQLNLNIFNNYYLIYKSFANIIIFIWLIYFISYSFLFGIVINYYFDYRNKILNFEHNNIEQKR